MRKRWTTFLAALTIAGIAAVCSAQTKYASHPPLRTAPPPSDRPMEKGPAHFVDAQRGNDANAGTKEAPWKTLGHSLEQLMPGDTLYLRGGTYYENAYCAVAGTQEKPVTIRSYPGEQAVLDGGLREFFEAPAQVWEPVTGFADRTIASGSETLTFSVPSASTQSACFRVRVWLQQKQ